MRERPLDAGVFVIFSVLLLGLTSRAADDGSAVVENQDVAWVAPMRRRTAADVGYDVAGDALVRSEDEDALGVRRGELAAAGPTCYKICDWCCGLRCFAAINTIPSVAPRVLVIAGDRGAAAERVWTASASMG